MKTSLSKSKSGDLFLPLIEEVQRYGTFFDELCLIIEEVSHFCFGGFYEGNGVCESSCPGPSVLHRPGARTSGER